MDARTGALENFNDKFMEELEKKRILANIFYKSQTAIEDFDNFKWHRNQYKKIDSHKVYSSQALAIDVFGFLKNAKAKDLIINKIFEADGTNWNIDFEFENKDLLNETKHPTQLDVKLENENTIIVIECKFTENDGGTCSQIQKNKNIKLPQCNGNYELQTNPVNGKKAFCALTAKNIEYWNYIPIIYNFYNSKSIYPCPFKNSNYQWMRNLCTAYVLGKNKNKKSKVFICYADFNFCPIKQKMDNNYLADINTNIKNEFSIKTTTYQKIIEIGILLSKQEEKKSWVELKTWLENKGTQAAIELKKKST